MTKNLIKSIAIALVFVPMVVLAETPAPTPASTPVSDSASTAGPVTSNSSASVANNPTGGSSSAAGPSTGGSSATVSNPSTGGSGSTAGPSTGGSSSTASNAIIPTPAPTPTPPPVTPPTGGNGGNGGGTGNGGNPGSSSGSSSSSGSRVAYAYACNQITSFMRYGANNDANQLIKLQTILRDAEKMNITVNGIFDKQTENAVVAFQNKYNSTIMGPWGSSKGSGYVYITTIKQINKIACSIPLSLSPQELTIINDYKNRRGIASSVIVTPKVENTPVQIEVKNEGNTITLTSSPETNTEVTASVTKASIMSRFVKFLVYLFK